METITSRDNAKIKYACAVRDSEKQRAADGVFFAEGPKLILELCTSCTPMAVYTTEAALARTPALAALQSVTTLVAPHVAEKLAGTKSSQGVFALLQTPAPPTHLLHSARRLLALEGVQDPGNVGTIIRLADWLGIGHVVCSPDVADVFGPKVVQATMGALARVRAFYTDVPAWLDKVPAALPVYGTFMAGSNLYAEPLPQGAIVVMGSEGRGISPEVERRITHRLTIPTFPPGRQAVESLNVAVATAMVCAEFRRR